LILIVLWQLIPLSVEARESLTQSFYVCELLTGSSGISQPWRLPYVESPVHLEFRTFIYSFTWEDPAKDLEHLELSEHDSILAITSAGDNVLHYAINAQPARIHSVDMNPWYALTLRDGGCYSH
jgi:Protein of unknown function (DUF3419)